MKLMTSACFGLLAVAIAAAEGCSSSNQAANPPMEAGTMAEGGGGGSSSGGASSSGGSSTVGEAGGEAGVYGDTGQPACDAIDLPAPAPGAGVQYQIALTLAGGQERQVCQMVQLDQDLDLNWSKGIMTNGSHHALVYGTPYNGSIPATALDGETIDGTQVQTCATPSLLWHTTAVLAGAQHVTPGPGANNLPQGTLPPNVAFKLKAGDFVLLNFHLLNPTNDTLNACYKVNLNGVPDAQVTEEAGTIFWFNDFITVPANGTSTAEMTCPITQNITVPAAVSHAHARLTNYVANLMTGDPTAGGTMVQQVYQGTDWDLPPWNTFSTPLSLTKGQWIDYHCDYTNTQDINVAEGQDTTDEMCMFIAPYWPRDPNLDFCISANGNANLGGHSYGYGTQTGADFLSCFWTTPQPTQVQAVTGGPSTSGVRYAFYSCITQTCPKASGPITPYIDCVTTNASSCQSQCTDLQSSFQDICAATPNTEPAPADAGADAGPPPVNGCQAQYGTNGSDGTCAAQAQTAAIAASTTAAQKAELTAQCQQTLCSAECAADASIPDGGVSCAACVGAFTGSTSNPTCLNQLTLAAVAAQTKTLAQDCVTQCFTGCITTRVTSCTVDCINNTACSSEYDAVATATCN